jgi:rhodanese-related sulfurtransferase
MEQLRPQQLADWLADSSRPKPVLLDVRQPWELERCCLPGVQNIPMHLIPLRLDELNKNDQIVAICHHGVRSMQVAMFLENQGFASINNLTGGVAAWANEVDPDFPRY